MISIIIPTYNRSNLLGDTLESILAQTYIHWECLVVDDGSTDYTAELIEFYQNKDARIRYYRRPNEFHRGANSCRNLGLTLAKGEFINWFDSDDLMLEDFLEKHMKILNKEKCSCSISNLKVFEQNIEDAYFFLDNKSTNGKILIDYITGKINLGVQCILWRKDFIFNFKFDESLFRAQELDFHFRVMQDKRFEACFLNETLSFLRRHNNSLTANYNAFNINSISSELNVRISIIRYCTRLNLDREILRKVLDMYFYGLKMLFYSGKISELYFEIKKLKKIFRLKDSIILWEGNLYIYLLLNKFGMNKFKLMSHFQQFHSKIK